MRGLGKLVLALSAGAAASIAALPALADGSDLTIYELSLQPTGPSYYSWMSPEVKTAWRSGYFGQGSTMTFVDDFSSNSRYLGRLTNRFQYQQHGWWTSEEASLIAPAASVVRQDFSTEQPISLGPGFTAVNVSYGLIGSASAYNRNWTILYPQEKSIIAAAIRGTALVAKSAGNDSTQTNKVAVGEAVNGGLDYLNVSLVGAQSAIFVGALDHNGTTSKPARLSSYSEIAGSDPAVQSHFLTVGVDYRKTYLAGTSFAAPVIAAYGAIVSSKFNSATPTRVAEQLLATARTDTVVNYTASTYGRGEASLSNALAPSAIR